ncbi:MAG: NTP transferase domain-containing protein [Thermoplasmatales archaeon]|nr:NTP transferase domain-containing protein [Thermoplasmatales archaeon]
MGPCGTEKPMQVVGGMPTVERVVRSIAESGAVDRVLVTVSDNTPETGEHLGSMGVETLHTSGTDFVKDLHAALAALESDYVLVCSSDLPFLGPGHVSDLAAFFRPEMESAVAVVPRETVEGIGSEPSYTVESGGKPYAFSGISIIDRRKTLAGVYLNEEYLVVEDEMLAFNINTQEDLGLAREIWALRNP